jgi:hypothetical protein
LLQQLFSVTRDERSASLIPSGNGAKLAWTFFSTTAAPRLDVVMTVRRTVREQTE